MARLADILDQMAKIDFKTTWEQVSTSSLSLTKIDFKTTWEQVSTSSLACLLLLVPEPTPAPNKLGRFQLQAKKAGSRRLRLRLHALNVLILCS